MWKAALAGALLATTTVNVSVAQNYEPTQAAARGPVVTPGHIARLKSALRLRPEQERYWPAVESALRRLAQSTGGWRQRGAGTAIDASAMRRVASAARALISRLDERQKQSGMRVVQAMGFGNLVASF